MSIKSKIIVGYKNTVLGLCFFFCYPFRRKLIKPLLPRPDKWAKPIEVEGIPNFHKVSDNLYRGAQPTAEGIKKLKEMGIKTIVNLRYAHTDFDEIGNTEIGYKHIIVKSWDINEDEIIRFLKIVADKKASPVFVHCLHGADRTGMMCAIHRIVLQGWENHEAVMEMTKGGFGFHTIWTNIISYLEKLDVEQYKTILPSPEQPTTTVQESAEVNS